MGFRGDDRGVTVQVGAVLLFGILIISMSMYQTTVVPDENEDVEFQHSQTVQQDLQTLRSSLVQAGSTGGVQPTVVKAGTYYPGRALFVNPPPVTGTVRATEARSMVVRNARTADANDETGDYWDGTERSFQTTTIEYDAQYHQYQNAPTTVYENSVVTNRFATGEVPLTDQALLRGNDIFLLTVGGELSKSRAAALSVDPKPVSVATRTVSIEDGGDPIELRVPTTLSEKTWEDLLRDQFGDNGYVDGDEEGVTVSDGVLTVTLEPGRTYDLKMARVGVGTGVTDEPAHYLTSVDGLTTATTGTTQTFTVEVRDEYNNPVSGQEVTFDADEGNVRPVGDRRSDEDGRVTFEYTAPNSPGDDTVRVSILNAGRPGFDGENRQDVEYDVRVQPSSGSGDGGARQSVYWVDPGSEPGPATNPAASCSDIPCGELSFSLGTDPSTAGESIELSSSDDSVVSLSQSSVTTDDSGTAQVALAFGGVGEATVRASDGTSSDDVTVATYLDSRFEGSLGEWRAFNTGGGYEHREPATSAEYSNRGDRSAEINVHDGGIETQDQYDTSRGGLLVVEYWATEDAPEPDDSEGQEDLVLEYLNRNGDWIVADRVEPAGDEREVYERQARISDPDAFHSGFKLRFRQLAADANSDAWYVDDVLFSQLVTSGSGSVSGDTTAPTREALSAEGRNTDNNKNNIEDVQFSFAFSDTSGISNVRFEMVDKSGKLVGSDTTTSSSGTVVVPLSSSQNLNNKYVQLKVVAIDDSAEANSVTCSGRIDSSGQTISGTDFTCN